MHIRIAGGSDVMGIIYMQWLHRQWGLGTDIGRLRCMVGLFHIMLPVNISP